ncbi:MAG: sigma-70 family RNA polymerase sigma factor [Planctomycetota bacterium]|nr:sigma-70 family RNA polymerase sigma factor [Planctomycetota bacterium]
MSEEKIVRPKMNLKAVGLTQRVALSAQVVLADETARPLWVAYFLSPGDDTRNALVEHYQKHVSDIVGRFLRRLPRTIDRGDLMTAANVGLIRSIEGYDPTRGVRFESYCERRVRGSLLDELRAQDWLPRPWRQRIEAHKRARATLRADLGRKPVDDEVARKLDMTLVDYERVFGISLPGAPAGSMPSGRGEEEGPSGMDVLADGNFTDPGDRLSEEELLKLVAQKLTDVEYRLVYLKYWEDLPMREIGQLLNLSESRVCKIHAKLLDRLKDRFRVNAFEA